MIEYVLILLLIAIFLLIYALNTTGRQEKLEKIDRLGGTNYIKQQLKTESADKIAEKHNLTLVSLDKYCQEHDTTINKLLKEIYRDNAKERERLRKEQERQIQQQEQERQRRIKQQQEQERQRREKERKIQEAYKRIDRLGGIEHIKQQLKTKNEEEIAQEYNINTENLNQYCQKQGTSINLLKNEIEKEKRQRLERLEKQREERQRREEEERQAKYIQNLKNEKRMRDY